MAVISNGVSYTDTFVYDQRGLPLALIHSPAGSAAVRYWYVLDGHANVVALTDSAGNVVDSYRYDAWGKPLTTSEMVAQPYRYASYWYDTELGWYWVQVRHYSPSPERWLQPDPSQQDGTLSYVYVGDDPVDATDPTGLNICGGDADMGGASLPVLNQDTGCLYTRSLIFNRAQAQYQQRLLNQEPDTEEPPTQRAVSPAPADGTATGDMTPGSPAHRAARWAAYQARGGKWNQRRWNNVYDRNMTKAQDASTSVLAAYMRTLSWDARPEVTVRVSVGGQQYARRLDLANVSLRYGVEVKTGYATASTENLWEVARLDFGH